MSEGITVPDLINGEDTNSIQPFDGINAESLGGSVGGLFGILGDWYKDITGVTGQQDIDKMNFKLELEKFAYDKDLQERIFQREDNAVQRKMADLEKAGLSKTLAAGSGASAGAVVPKNTPQMGSAGKQMQQKAMADLIGTVMNLATMKADIARTNAQTSLIKSQANKTKTEADFMKDNNPQLVKQNQIKAELAEASKYLNLQQLGENLNLTREQRSKLNKEIAMLDYDYQLKTQYEWTLRQIQQDQEYSKLEKYQQEALALKISNELKDMDLEKFRSIPTPSTMTGGDVGYLSSFILNALKDAGGYEVFGSRNGQ